MITLCFVVTSRQSLVFIKFWALLKVTFFSSWYLYIMNIFEYIWIYLNLWFLSSWSPTPLVLTHTFHLLLLFVTLSLVLSLSICVSVFVCDQGNPTFGFKGRDLHLGNELTCSQSSHPPYCNLRLRKTFSWSLLVKLTLLVKLACLYVFTLLILYLSR